MKRYWVLMVSAIALTCVCENMKIHVVGLQHFEREPVPLDLDVYKLFTKDPIPMPINYLAFPSVWMKVNKKSSILKDVKLDGGFAVCQCAAYENFYDVLRNTGIDIVFTPGASQKTDYGSLRVLPMPYHAKYRFTPAENKDLWYSFIGLLSHPIRNEIFNLPPLSNVVIKRREQWHYWQKDEQKKKREHAEYANVLGRSRFSLCPRGYGVGTLRFWESLGAGAIPVLIPAEEVVLPGTFDWDSCVIAIKKSDIPYINQILATITPEQEELMREQCYKAYEQFSGDNIVSCIRSYYEDGPWEPWRPNLKAYDHITSRTVNANLKHKKQNQAVKRAIAYRACKCK